MTAVSATVTGMSDAIQGRARAFFATISMLAMAILFAPAAVAQPEACPEYQGTPATNG